MNPEELNQLIDALLDGDCSEADFLRLEAELHVNPKARQTYYERLKLHTALQVEAEAQGEAAKIVPFPNWKTHAPWLAGIAAAIVLFAAVGLGWQLGQGSSETIAAKSEPIATGFAVVAEQSDAIWESQSLGRGDLVPEGLLKLKSGIVQLELFSGVTVILEGESEFEVVSAMEMAVNQGKLRAMVPEPAQGFKVRTATGEVVDLGTEFTLDVTEQHADLHVLDGKIEWHPSAKPKQTLGFGDSLRWKANGESTQLESGVEQFPGLSDLASRKDLRRQAWQKHSDQLRHDPRLLAYFPMDHTSDRQLVDESGEIRHGTIVRAQRTANRWGQSFQALDFSPTGSRVRLTIPGEHSALTFYCWVRIDSLDRWYNSLFLTDGHELHEPHWQIMDDGRLFFSVKARQATRGNPDKHIAFSPPIWTPALSGKWMQIATVYNSATKTTTHYVNGEQISQDVLADHYVVEKVRIGAASIGNWSEPMREDPHFAVRNLNGAIDEFAIFAAALTAEEIAELYQLGKP